MQLDLQPGDLFLTCGTSKISKAINSFQRWWSIDNTSIYSHAGIIVDSTGRTFEAKFSGVNYFHLDDMKDQPLLIARHDFMLPQVFNKAFERLQYHTGLMYPFHRIFLHIIPPLAKVFAKDKAVCSEIVGQLLYHAELLSYWKGINPDDLHDMFINWKYYNIIFKRD